MSKLTYREQLLHPNWQRKRLEILNRDGFSCRMCGDSETTLHVHHKQYARGRLAWEYPNDELVALCEPCHGAMHEEVAGLRDVTAKLPLDGPGSVDDATALLAGWANGEQGMDFKHMLRTDPQNYVAGELANRLAKALDLEEAMNLVQALGSAPPWVIRAVLRSATQEMLQRKDEPPPPDYLRSLDDLDL